MSTKNPIIIGSDPPKRSAIFKKWGVWAGGVAVTIGGAILASPEFGQTVIGIVSSKVDPASVGGTLVLMGAQQVILAARRALLGIPDAR